MELRVPAGEWSSSLALRFARGRYILVDNPEILPARDTRIACRDGLWESSIRCCSRKLPKSWIAGELFRLSWSGRSDAFANNQGDSPRRSICHCHIRTWLVDCSIDRWSVFPRFEKSEKSTDRRTVRTRGMGDTACSRHYQGPGAGDGIEAWRRDGYAADRPADSYSLISCRSRVVSGSPYTLPSRLRSASILVVNRCPSEIRSTSIAIASTDADSCWSCCRTSFGT